MPNMDEKLEISPPQAHEDISPIPLKGFSFSSFSEVL